MAKKGKKPVNKDPNQWAAQVVTSVTGLEPPKGVLAALIKRQEAAKRVKNPAAVALGRLGGLVGGKARAAKLTPEKRREIAKKAAKTRWAHKKAAELPRIPLSERTVAKWKAQAARQAEPIPR